MSEEKKIKKKSLKESKALFTIVSILIGFLAGALVLRLAGYAPWQAYKLLFEGVFKSPRNIGRTIVNSTPIILTGLGVCFGFQAGLFNMGAEGQFIIGSLVGFLLGYRLNLPPFLHVIITIFVAMVVGGLYGGLVGLLKAKLGIHEVISTIMLNRVAFYLQNFLVTTYKKPNSMSTFDVQDTAKITLFPQAKLNFEGGMKRFFKAPIHGGVIAAIVAVIVVYYILKKTTLGYEIKAVGLNKEACEYGGINTDKRIIQAMTIGGILCSLGGVTQLLGYTYALPQLSAMENFGFDGLAVSLLASNNPIGCIFTGLFFGGLKYAGSNLQRVMGVPSEIINIIIGVIVLFTAIPLVFKIISAKHKRRKEERRLG